MSFSCFFLINLINYSWFSDRNPHHPDEYLHRWQELQKRHYQRSRYWHRMCTTNVKFKNVPFTTLLVQATGHGSGSWFTNNIPHNVQTGNNTSIPRCLPVGITEISCRVKKKSLNSILNHTIYQSKSNFPRIEKHDYFTCKSFDIKDGSLRINSCLNIKKLLT